MFSERGGAEYLSLEDLLDDAHDAGRVVQRVHYHVGAVSVASWRRLRRVYGDTVVRLSDEAEDVTWKMTLRRWCEQTKAPADGWFDVVKVQRTEPISAQRFIVKHQIEDGLKKLSDGQLMFLWMDRKKLDQSVRGVYIRKLWDELEIRHEGLTRRAIKISIPFVHGLDTRLVKQELTQLLEKVGAGWPVYVKEWHLQNMSISTKMRESIADVMCNVNQPWKYGDGCVCQEVCQRLAQRRPGTVLPQTEGHIFMIGRDYDGPFKEVLQTHACDIPKPTGWDVKRTWQSVKTQLPVAFKEATSDAQWMMGLNACHKPTQAPPSKVNTAAMYTLRKELKGLVRGPLDKNGGELCFACP